MVKMLARDDFFVLAFIATWQIAGFLEPFAPSYGQPITEVWLPHVIALGVLLFAWCKAHASARGQAPPTYAAALAGLAWPVGVPLYFFRALPWRSALLSSGKAILVFLFSALLYADGMSVGLRLAP